MNMFAYDCPNAIPPKTEVGGNIYKCTEKDVAELVDFLDLFDTFNVNVFPEKTVSSQPNLTKYSTTCKLRLVDRRSLLFYD